MMHPVSKSKSVFPVSSSRWPILRRADEKQQICDHDGSFPEQIWKSTDGGALAGFTRVRDNVGDGNTHRIR